GLGLARAPRSRAAADRGPRRSPARSRRAGVRRSRLQDPALQVARLGEVQGRREVHRGAALVDEAQRAAGLVAAGLHEAEEVLG
ncbi:MAG: hypothetical protein ACK559_27840, partial [bacterium]